MSLDILFNNAVAHHQAGELAEAENLYRKILEVSPETPDALHLLGLIAHQKGVTDTAVDLIYKAIVITQKENNTPANYYFSIGCALQDKGLFEEAIDNYKLALEITPDISEIYNNIGNAYRSLKRYEKATMFFEKAIELSPDFALAYNNLGLTFIDSKDFEKAVSYFKHAVEIEPEFFDAHYNLGNLYRDKNLIDKAVSEYETALVLSPENANIYNSLGVAFERNNQLDKALAAYKKSVEIAPSFSDAHNNIGNILLNMSKLEEARKAFETAIKLNPELADSHSSLGIIFQRQNKIEQALDEYRKAFVINPNIAETCNNLGMMVQENGDDDEALGLYFNALAINPELDDVHFNINNALQFMFSQGRVENATKIAQNWLKLYPNNPLAKHIVESFTKKGSLRASNDYLKQTFDAFSEEFDDKLKKMNYQAPKLLVEQVSKLFKANKTLSVLDAGCGTGLCASMLRPFAKKLNGLDISAGMLEKARNLNLYDELIEQELTEHLLENPNRYDLIIASDVLCYFGRLDSIIDAMETALKPDGAVAFTLEYEKDAKKGFQIKPTGRYSHSLEYLESVINETTGFSIVHTSFDTLRMERENSVTGIISVLKKQAMI
ncbi:MAG: tetratricopeptide repeat protein [Alphaproteobacteria bacterium]|nr:tetratricopeptide repeat protein [Alphaproteobacteria bacterium]